MGEGPILPIMMIILPQISLLTIAMIHVPRDGSLLIDRRTVVTEAFLVDDPLVIDAAPAKRSFQDDGVRSHSAGKKIYSQLGRISLRHWPLDANLHKTPPPPPAVTTTMTENS